MDGTNGVNVVVDGTDNGNDPELLTMLDETVPAAEEKPAGGEPDKAHAGLVNDLQGERGRRQAAEQENAQLRTNLAALQQSQPTAEPEKSMLDEIKNADFINGAQMHALLTEQEQRFEQRVEAKDTERRNAALTRSEQRAHVEMSVQRMGTGLDFATVCNEGGAYLTAGDRAAISQADDPAREAYNRCIMLNPVLKARHEAHLIGQNRPAPPADPNPQVDPYGRPVNSTNYSPNANPNPSPAPSGPVALKTLLDLPDGQLDQLMNEVTLNGG